MGGWTDRWRRLQDRLHALVDSLTHSQQRTLARNRLARGKQPTRILVVCTGNICRSPYAAHLIRNSVTGNGFNILEVDSAGFIGPGRAADPQGVKLARSRGVDLGGHVSRLVRQDDGESFDLIVVMTHRHRQHLMSRFGVAEERIVLLGDFDPEDPPSREIADPYGKSDAAFETAFLQIERSVEGLTEHLAKSARAS